MSSYCWSRRKRRTPWATMLLLGLGQAAMAFVPVRMWHVASPPGRSSGRYDVQTSRVMMTRAQAPNGHLLARRVVRDSGRPFWLGASSTSGVSTSIPRRVASTVLELIHHMTIMNEQESISPSEAGQEEDGAPRKATMTIEVRAPALSDPLTLLDKRG